MDKVKSFFTNIDSFGAASQRQSQRPPVRSPSIARTGGGGVTCYKAEKMILFCAKLERILSLEAGDHITFSLYILSLKELFFNFRSIHTRLRRCFVMVLLEQMAYVPEKN